MKKHIIASIIGDNEPEALLSHQFLNRSSHKIKPSFLNGFKLLIIPPNNQVKEQRVEYLLARVDWVNPDPTLFGPRNHR
jgi:hypothetical protein